MTVTIGLMRLICHKCKQPANFLATTRPEAVKDFLNKNVVFLCLNCGQTAVDAQTVGSLGL